MSTIIELIQYAKLVGKNYETMSQPERDKLRDEFEFERFTTNDRDLVYKQFEQWREDNKDHPNLQLNDQD